MSGVLERESRSLNKRIPSCRAQTLLVDSNPIDQILIRDQLAIVCHDGDGAYRVQLDSDEVAEVVCQSAVGILGGRKLVLPDHLYATLDSVDDVSAGVWVGERDLHNPVDVRQSLADSFRFVEEDPASGRQGLRPPQLGALHTVLGYWTTKKQDPVTVVMPTGTGKTETMLSLLCAGQLERLLVVVPSDALRSQIAEKFLSLGVLQEFGVVSSTSLRPVVGQVKHAFTDETTAGDFARRCSVIIATPDALRASGESAWSALYDLCTHLFVDEAHHIAAATWSKIRGEFTGKPVIQFTATPFREDDRRLGGRILYSFPLREAQRLEYFSRINYISVLDFHDHDRAIAGRAIEQLRSDLAAGFDHLIMARVNQISRADEILPIYRSLGAEFRPMILHSNVPESERRGALDAIERRESRIVVCVDMLGEGFDLPSLKIAAIHDPHKSLGVTLQFIGRFSRNVPGKLGDATVVVGRPEGEYDDRLRKLYAEDADWDLIVRDISEAAVEGEQEINDFEEAFGSLPEDVSIRSLLPKMSTVVYRVGDADWDPHKIYDIYPAEQVITDPLPVNERDGVAWFVVEQHAPIEWGEVNVVENTTYDLYVLYWNRERGLLYINSSYDSHHEDIAKAVCGKTASRITGEVVYRSMANINRLVPTNVGVLDVRNRSRRFSLHVGTDVTVGLPVAETQTKTKTNLFAYGYEGGNRVSIGASLKGRIWSYRIAKTLKHWVDWCNSVGSKVTDESISVDEVMRHFIRPQALTERPKLIALALEWPWEIFADVKDELKVEHNGSAWPIIDTELVLRSFTDTGPIEIRVVTPEWQLDYDLRITGGAMKVVAIGADAQVRGRRSAVSLSDYLDDHGLQIYLEDDATVTADGILLKPDRDLPPYDVNLLRDLDWTGIKLSVESQGASRRPDSIQAYMIEQVKSLADWDVVLDDDLANEIADIVALRSEGGNFVVHLTHCKFVSEWEAGKRRARVEDLYEVCGQAMKSVQWRRNINALFSNLIRRQKQYRDRTGSSGFMVGNERKLLALQDQARMLRPQFTIAIAQPGVQKRRVKKQQLDLLASTEIYVHEVAALLFANLRAVEVPPTRQCPARKRMGKPILSTPATDPRHPPRNSRRRRGRMPCPTPKRCPHVLMKARA